MSAREWIVEGDGLVGVWLGWGGLYQDRVWFVLFSMMMFRLLTVVPVLDYFKTLRVLTV